MPFKFFMQPGESKWSQQDCRSFREKYSGAIP